MNDENQTPEQQAPAEPSALDPQAQAAAREYPGLFAPGASLPDEVTALQAQGAGLLEACRLYDLRQTKTALESLRTELEAERTSRRSAAASTGSAASSAAYEKDYFTPQEWDDLPQRQREKFIRNGKIFDFMKKWNGD